MSRRLRIEFPGAVYHVTSRGDRRGLIYRDDEDRASHLEVIAWAMDRFNAQVLACCQMGNHFHLVLHPPQANLSRLMRHVNGVYRAIEAPSAVRALGFLAGQGTILAELKAAFADDIAALFGGQR